jgi:hypothetical protein
MLKDEAAREEKKKALEKIIGILATLTSKKAAMVSKASSTREHKIKARDVEDSTSFKTCD